MGQIRGTNSPSFKGQAPYYIGEEITGREYKSVCDCQHSDGPISIHLPPIWSFSAPAIFQQTMENLLQGLKRGCIHWWHPHHGKHWGRTSQFIPCKHLNRNYWRDRCLYKRFFIWLCKMVIMWADLRKGPTSRKTPKFDGFQPIITWRHQEP